MFAPPLYGGRRLRAGRSPAVGALVIAIFALGLAESDPFVFWGALYFIPIVVIAQVAGSAGGVATGGLALAFVAAWAQIKGVNLGVRGYLLRAFGFLFVGWVAGGAWTGGGGQRDRRARDASPSLEAPPGTAEINEREARRRDSYRLAGLGTWELDLGTGEMEWSDEYRSLYGVDPRKFMSSRRVFEEIVHPEDREIVTAALQRIVRDGTTLEIRYRIIRPSDGAERCIRSHIHSQRDPAGKPVRLLGSGQDVTDLVVVLSPREREMLVLLAEGVSGEEIADQLFLSPATVRTHVQNAMVKLGAHTRGEAIATAMRSGEIGS